MPKLYYVDDQTDYKATLSHVMSIATAGTTSIPDTKMYTDVESFMKDVEKASPDPSDGFLLDINMPVPRWLKTQPNIWPANHAGEDQFCGIALAKWLLSKSYAANHDQVAFITHWETLQDEHEAAMQELSIGNIKFNKKSEAIPLQDWIKERFP